MFTELYVLDLTGNRILRVALADGSVSTVVSDAGPAPDGLVIDQRSQRLYWTTMGKPSRISVAGTDSEAAYDFTTPNGSVRSASLDGTDVRIVLDDGRLTTGKQIAADFANERLYVSDREGFAVRSVRTDGSDLVDLIRNVDDRSGTEECVGVAIDPAGGRLYWTQKGPSKGGQGRILRARLNVPDGEAPDARSDIEVLWDGLPEPIDLELDTTRGVIFWTDRGAPPNGNTLNRARIPQQGSRGEAPAILAEGFAEAIGLALDSTADTIYVTDLGGSIRAIPLDSKLPQRIVAHIDNAHLTGIAGR